MTVQYEQPNINGMPAPASLAYNSSCVDPNDRAPADEL